MLHTSGSPLLPHTYIGMHRACRYSWPCRHADITTCTCVLLAGVRRGHGPSSQAPQLISWLRACAVAPLKS
jgi:hypothetical protein